MFDYDEDTDMAAARARRAAWVTDDDIKNLGLERATGIKSVEAGPETHLQQAQRIVREAAPMAASNLVRLAQYGENENVRLKASLEILNRAEQSGSGKDGREPWAEVYESVLSTTDVENFANGLPGTKP